MTSHRRPTPQKSVTEKSIPSNASKHLRTQLDFALESRALSSDLGRAIPAYLRNFDYTELVNKSKRCLRSRDFRNQKDITLIDLSFRYIMNINVDIATEISQQCGKNDIGADDFMVIQDGVFVRAMCGENAISLEIFKLIDEHIIQNKIPLKEEERDVLEARKALAIHSHNWLVQQGLLNVPNTVKIVLVGDAGVGKTALIERFGTGTFDSKTQSTMVNDFLQKKFERPGGGVVTVNFWDTAGQERFRSLATFLTRDADGLLVVHVNDDPNNIELPENPVRDFPNEVVWFRNKIDLLPHPPALSLVEATFCGSAKTGEGVEAAFTYLIEKIAAKRMAAGTLVPDEQEVRKQLPIKLHGKETTRVHNNRFRCSSMC